MGSITVYGISAGTGGSTKQKAPASLRGAGYSTGSLRLLGLGFVVVLSQRLHTRLIYLMRSSVFI